MIAGANDLRYEDRRRMLSNLLEQVSRTLEDTFGKVIAKDALEGQVHRLIVELAPRHDHTPQKEAAPWDS